MLPKISTFTLNHEIMCEICLIAGPGHCHRLIRHSVVCVLLTQGDSTHKFRLSLVRTPLLSVREFKQLLMMEFD